MQVTPVAYLRFYAAAATCTRCTRSSRAGTTWCADVYDSHTSYPMLLWFRSRQPGRSWTVGLGIVLEAASYVLSTRRPAESPRGAGPLPSGRDALDAIRSSEPRAGRRRASSACPTTRSGRSSSAVYDAIVEMGLPGAALRGGVRAGAGSCAPTTSGTARAERGRCSHRFEFRTHARPIPIACDGR